MKINYDGFCEQGNRPGNNQDAIGMFAGGDYGLFFVADGMGGHSGGERASSAVKKACSRWWDQYRQQLASADFIVLMKSLKQLLNRTSQEIWETTELGEICGTTVVLLFIYKEHYGLIWSGDSRCYLATKKMLRSRVRILTQDDIWENQPEIIKNYPHHEIASNKNNGKLTRALGAAENFSCTLLTGNLPRKSLFLLCSDGIYKYIAEGALESAVKHALMSGRLAAENAGLRQLVYQNNAPDNLSSILIQTGT